jgi:hypothetical protein
MMQAGMQVGGSPKNETRLVLGLSLPVRNFASTFIAAGIIYERAENSIEHNDKYSYFEFLKSLHLLTPVSILVKTGGEWRRRPGKFEGIGNDGSREYISILYVDNEKKKLQCKRPYYVDNCNCVTVTEENVDISSVKRKGYKVVNNFEFMSAFIPDGHLSDFTTASRMDCLIISSKQRMLSEIEHQLGINRNDAGYTCGNLADIIRPKNRYAFGQSYRSLICSANSKRSPANPEYKPWCVIIDSAAGYLKWHHCFDTSHQIVILDRSERFHHTAAQHLNGLYYQRIDSKEDEGLQSNVPPGVEMILFREKYHA